jgi:ABC-type multidrug transport system fused ATPase/permease subunit
MRGSLRIHKKMLNSIMLSPMAFFDVTPSGRILNRFSKDMDVSKYFCQDKNLITNNIFSGHKNSILHGDCWPVLNHDLITGFYFHISAKDYLIIPL